MTVFLPTRRLLLLLAAAALLFLWAPAAALAGDAVLLALALWDARVTGGARAVRVSRQAPGRVARGTSAPLDLVVRNPGPRPLAVRLVEDLPEGLEPDPDIGEKRALELEPAESRRISRTVHAVGRGDVILGDVHLRVRGPLGLLWRAERVPGGERVRIQPGVLEMRRSRLLGLRHRMRAAGLRNVRQRGEGRAFESLRPYVQGDDPRAIDWKATARRRNVLVRQYEAERSQNVVLAVDAGRCMMERVGDAERLDHALSAALLLGDVAVSHGDRLGLLAFADTVQQFLPPARVPLPRVADALAGVRARAVEPNYPLAFSFLLRQVRRRSLVVFFSDVIDPDASGAVLTELTRAAARHVVLVVALRNPAVAAWADAPVEDEAGAYRRAAAEEMLQARTLALATLRRKGVLIADAAPEDAVTEVVNRYLEVKYRGRI